MYPFVRIAKEFWINRNRPTSDILETHISQHICWPQDLDFFFEMNNGRILTIYDLGRMPMAGRAGLIKVLRKQGWGLTMAGASVRYRRRIRAFERFEMRSRVSAWDERFIYLEQSMWKKNGECANHILYRSAVTDSNGIVPTDHVFEAMGRTAPPVTMPDWVEKWAQADAARPWPPMQDG